MAKLILLTGDIRKEFALGTFNTMGRSPQNSVALLDRIVSREHAQIIQQPDGSFLLRDLGTLNATYLNNVRVNEQILRSGDEIRLGATRLLYTEHPDQDSAARPAATVNKPAGNLLEDASSREEAKLGLVSELAQMITQSSDLGALLPHILDRTCELLGAERGAVLLKKNDAFTSRYSKPRHSRTAHEHFVVSRAIVNTVIQERRALLAADASMDARFIGSSSIIMQGIRAVMCAPLLSGDELLGMFYLDSQIATNVFAERDLKLLSVIANQAAIAVHDAC